MKNICKKRKKYNSVMILRTKIFTIWILTLILPLLVVMGYSYVLPGNSFITEGLGRLDQQVWQIDGFNLFNQTSKYFNNIILENPDDVLDVESYRDDMESGIMKSDHFLVLIKKDDDLILLNRSNFKK